MTAAQYRAAPALFWPSSNGRLALGARSGLAGNTGPVPTCTGPRELCGYSSSCLLAQYTLEGFLTFMGLGDSWWCIAFPVSCPAGLPRAAQGWPGTVPLLGQLPTSSRLCGDFPEQPRAGQELPPFWEIPAQCWSWLGTTPERGQLLASLRLLGEIPAQPGAG